MPPDAAAPQPGRGSRGRFLRALALLLLLTGAWGGWRLASGSGPIRGGSPPPSLWAVATGETLQPPGADWVTLKHPTYEYDVDCPPLWTVSDPAGFTMNRARLFQAPLPSRGRILVIPWGIYEEPLQGEVEKAEGGWLLSGPRVVSCRRTREDWTKVGERDALVREYEAVLEDGVAWTARATYVVARPKCYAVILLAPAEESASLRGVYERVVGSFVARNPDGDAPGTGPQSPGG